MRNIIAILLCVCSLMAMQAQDNTIDKPAEAEKSVSGMKDEINADAGKDASKYRFGLKLGINYSSFYGDTAYLTDGLAKPDLKFALTAGFILNYKLGHNFSLQPELLFANQGSRFWYHEHPYEDGKPTKYSLYYINLPILVKYEFLENLFVHTGPTFGYALKGNKEHTKEGVTITENITSDLDKPDVGFNFGIEMFMTKHLFLNAEYTLGLKNVLKNDENMKTKNVAMLLSMGYMF